MKGNMKGHSHLLFSVEQIRFAEHLAIKNGTSEDILMERAGRAAFAVLKTYFSQVKHIAVYCGGGNNGGDGYWVAYLAALCGIKVYIFSTKATNDLPPVVQKVAKKALSKCTKICSINEAIPDEVELIVDALLGIGLSGPVKASLASVIDQINRFERPVLSIDVPSGLQADTGVALKNCVKATITVTFIGRKQGMYTLDGIDYCGKIICHNLELEDELLATPSSARFIEEKMVQRMRPVRTKNVHKGMFGHVLIVGGGQGMPGAVHLAASAALRTGAGMVTVATSRYYTGHALCGLPEAMIYDVSSKKELSFLLKKASVCIIGPGLGEDKRARMLLQAALESKLPLVIDASALRLLNGSTYNTMNWVLTPHPGEAASLLQCSVNEIQHNRFYAVREIQKKYHGTVVLKGAGTLIQTEENGLYVASGGHSGMATAGMGDVLSGIIGGLIAQKVHLSQAAMIGVYMHLKAAENARLKIQEHAMIASDVIDNLGSCI